MNNQKEIILIKDLGMEFPTSTSKRKSRYGLFKCFCGTEFKSVISSVQKLDTKSCGCIRGVNHNLTSHRLYGTWNMMMARCYNPKNKFYSHYGAIGITVCKEWHSTENFINDMYPTFIEGLTLDRKESSKNYNKLNCRWATKTTQSRNIKTKRKNNISGYKGVSIFRNKYQATIRISGKAVYIGVFNNAIDAAYAYDNYIIENNLDHTKNF